MTAIVFVMRRAWCGRLALCSRGERGGATRVQATAHVPGGAAEQARFDRDYGVPARSFFRVFQNKKKDLALTRIFRTGVFAFLASLRQKCSAGRRTICSKRARSCRPPRLHAQ